MLYLKDLGLGSITYKYLTSFTSFSTCTGLSLRETEKCQAFQESLNSDVTVLKNINQLDLSEIDNFMNHLINCKGHLYVSGIGWCIGFIEICRIFYFEFLIQFYNYYFVCLLSRQVGCGW